MLLSDSSPFPTERLLSLKEVPLLFLLGDSPERQYYIFVYCYIIRTIFLIESLTPTGLKQKDFIDLHDFKILYK